ncbi:MAG: hypothetical protein ABSE86_38520 [Bryobacteraceae bacterium]|jgi:hypothetical protein
MTLFDLLFIVLVMTALATLIGAMISALRGHRARAFRILRTVAMAALVYVGIVYIAAAWAKPVVLKVGDPECSDDWCIAVDHVERTPKSALMIYEVTLRIFSRARRVAQRENVARDAYLVDAYWKRYDPILIGAEIPLNTLLQPGKSVSTSRRFELPVDARGIGLMVDRSSILPFCLIIGECEAFHKGTVIRLD